ncbi:unnamed protein product [Schistosoma curassoni]|uniref:Abortive infection protein n=1 Tax=Schistosoma curassoni TaxID=6186 RepID=A0A183JPM1_9TREM|nr:unnamed protein product [Schistosoma curassoni]
MITPMVIRYAISVLITLIFGNQLLFLPFIVHIIYSALIAAFIIILIISVICC